MAKYDLYAMPGHGRLGYVVDVQAELLDTLRSRAVIPLLPLAMATPVIQTLNPVFEIAGEPHVLLTQALASVAIRELRPARLSLALHDSDITRALDILLTGL